MILEGFGLLLVFGHLELLSVDAGHRWLLLWFFLALVDPRWLLLLVAESIASCGSLLMDTGYSWLQLVIAGHSWFSPAEAAAFPRLDLLINNAAQTVRRPASHYAQLLQSERTPLEERLDAWWRLCIGDSYGYH